MTINREHLAPCPFCGGEAETIECSDASWYVICATSKCGGQTPFGKTKPEAIGRWNTRAQAAPEAEPVVQIPTALMLWAWEDDMGDDCDWNNGYEAARGYVKAQIQSAIPTAPRHDAELVAWVRRSGRFGCKQYMTDRQYQAQSALMRANYEPYSCARCTAPQHDAELVELLNLAADTLDDVCHGSMLEQTIRAKLATLRHV